MCTSTQSLHALIAPGACAWQSSDQRGPFRRDRAGHRAGYRAGYRAGWREMSSTGATGLSAASVKR